MDEKFDLMEKIQKKIFFPWKESVNLGPRAAFQLNPLRNYSPTKTEKIGKMLKKKNRQNVRGEIPAFNMKIIH